MNKSILLEFKNAKFFKNAGKDVFVKSRTQRIKRIETEHFIEPITVHQVSNMIHALFGERPISTLRGSAYSNISYYVEKAKNSLIKINNFKDEDKFLEEVMTLNKAPWDSWKQKGINVSWHVIEKYLGTNFDWFVGELSRMLDTNVVEIDFQTCLDDYSEFKKLETQDDRNFMSELVHRRCKGLVDYFGDRNLASYLVRNDRIRLHNNSGIGNVTVLNGHLIIPVNEEDIAKLRETKGSATILDGGMVKIIGIKDNNEISDSGYIKVSEISTKKQKYEN